MVSTNLLKMYYFLTCICFVILRFGFVHANQPTFEYGDCQEYGASYTYGNFVICYWIDYAPLQHGTAHCGNYDYAWVPDSGANDILYQLALTRGTTNIMYHIGYTIDYTTPTDYTVIGYGNGEPQNYSAFISAMDTSKTCVGFKDGHWDAIFCTLYREAFCSLVIDFTYGDCRENGVSYIDGLDLYCYWIDNTKQQSTNACGLEYSVIPNVEAQRVVNWLIKVRNLSSAGTYYHIGYKENPNRQNGVETHYGVAQDWTNWDVDEPNPTDNNIDNCIIIKQPYGFWRDYTCTLLLMSICSTVRKVSTCPKPVVFYGSTLLRQTGDTYGDTCHYVCDIGHVLVSGNLTRTCQIDGFWDYSPPVCRVETSQTTTEVISTPEPITSDMSTSRTTETTTSNQKVVETTTLSTSRTTSGLCICACSLVANITIDIEQRIEELTKLLTVDKEVLSSTIRRLTCADDPRPSSAYIGYTGAIVVGAVFTFIIIIDIINIYLFCKTFPK
ncbi:unnamed protein product [Mytilus coruscus]|uniref:Sushi domain-containing protein n=1 Tax=Mytilus coruscus TaxID=42192 RepID=A0A6J8CW75_MYTCO|nr:unnamed protein product [Mytilus coruscus]